MKKRGEEDKRITLVVRPLYMLFKKLFPYTRCLLEYIVVVSQDFYHFNKQFCYYKS